MAGQYELGDLSSQLNSDLYNQLFSTQGFTPIEEGGFSGNYNNPWSGLWEGNNEVGNQMYNYSPTEGAMNTFKGYSFDWTPEGIGGGTLNAFDPSGKAYGTYKQKGSDWMDQLAGMVIPAFVTGGFGSALGGAFGGGVLGKAAGQGLAGGISSSMQGGNFGQGLLSGAIGGGLEGLSQGTPAVMGNNPSAYVPATPGTSLAGSAGITNPTLAGMFNRGVGTTLGGLAGGKNMSDALKGSLVGAGLAGVNSLGKNIMNPYMDSLKSFLGGGTQDMGAGSSVSDELDSLGGNMVSDPMDQSVDPSVYSDEGARFDNSADFSYGFQPSNFLGGSNPDQSIQSAGPDSSPLASIFGNVGSRAGNFALNNIGDLASMLYGFYNNRRQQKALGQQVSSLQGLYGQNSPYAQQLRNTLNAKAASTGRRSNTAGRETQFQAMLADRAASMAPTLMQLNQARGSLKNNNMNMLLQGANKMGLFSGLGSLFGNTSPYANYSMANNPSDYNSLGIGRP